MKPNILVFDVKSTGLFGTGFAVGAVVMDQSGKEIDRFELVSLEELAKADEWLQQHVIPHLKKMPTCGYAWTLRERFYEFYLKHKDTAEIWVDCGFPRETNFLNEIFKDTARELPYPLMDIAVYVDVYLDRIELSGLKGLQEHNPLHGAIASATVLIKAKKQLSQTSS